MSNQYIRGDKESNGQIRHRWGPQAVQQENESSLLTKKDQQIKRLQSQLQNERKRADNALKILDSFRSSHKIEEQMSSNAKTQVSRRLKAEEQARKLKSQNQLLKSILAQYLEDVKAFQNQMGGVFNR